MSTEKKNVFKLFLLKIIQILIVIFALLRLIPSGIIAGLKWLEGRLK